MQARQESLHEYLRSVSMDNLSECELSLNDAMVSKARTTMAQQMEEEENVGGEAGQAVVSWS
jgi:hypothetical protein